MYQAPCARVCICSGYAQPTAPVYGTLDALRTVVRHHALQVLARLQLGESNPRG